MDAHRVSFLIYPGISAFDVAGPGKALALAAEGGGRYEVTLRSVRGGLVESDCPGVSFNSVPSLPSPPAIDTLFIPGGLNAATASKDPELVASAKRLAACAKRIACVCTGAFLAAEAGLLTGRRAATHWRFCSQFVERFHDVKLEPDKIWVQDGQVWSSAGVSAGVDLTLALIEKDHGGPLALRVARDLVVFFKRPGGSVSVQHGTVWADRGRRWHFRTPVSLGLRTIFMPTCEQRRWPKRLTWVCAPSLEASPLARG